MGSMILKVLFTVFTVSLLFIEVEKAYLKTQNINAQELVTVTRLNIAPWLGEKGEIKDRKDLLHKFQNEKENFINFVIYDLKAIGLNISRLEAINFYEQIEKQLLYAPEIVIRDGEILLSMGWKSRSTKKILRTGKLILKVNENLLAYQVIGKIKGYEVEYVILRKCGNICLRKVVPPAVEVPTAVEMSTSPAVPVPTPPPSQPTQPQQPQLPSQMKIELYQFAHLAPSPVYLYPSQPQPTSPQIKEDNTFIGFMILTFFLIMGVLLSLDNDNEEEERRPPETETRRLLIKNIKKGGGKKISFFLPSP